MSIWSWTFDPAHSTVGFTVRHLMVTRIHGRFQKWSGTLEIDEEDITRSRVAVTIDTRSVDTREENRDAHLRSADFFNTEKYPRMTFVSTSITKKSATEVAVTGELSVNGHTRSIVLDVETTDQVKDPWGGTRQGFAAKAAISRRDFGLTWNTVLEAGGVLVADKVEIELDVQAIKATA